MALHMSLWSCGSNDKIRNAYTLFIIVLIFLICTGPIVVSVCWVGTEIWAKEMLANLKL